MLVKNNQQGKNDKAIFKFFLTKFQLILNDPSSSHRDISLAIKGYGYLAAPCKIFLNTEDVKFMFNEMIQRSEQIFFSVIIF